MLQILIDTFITFSVVYTLLSFVKFLYNLFRTKDEFVENTYVILRICNQENNIEHIVRMLICKYLKISNGEFVPNILIIDMGSKDKTPDICKKLCDDYSFVYYTTYEEYSKMTDLFK